MSATLHHCLRYNVDPSLLVMLGGMYYEKNRAAVNSFSEAWPKIARHSARLASITCKRRHWPANQLAVAASITDTPVLDLRERKPFLFFFLLLFRSSILYPAEKGDFCSENIPIPAAQASTKGRIILSRWLKKVH